MEPLEKQSVRLMVYRMVVVLTFFVSALAVQAFVGGETTLKPFYYLIAFVLALNLAYAVAFSLLHSLRGRPLFLYLQILGDVVAVTLLCSLTGGMRSIFTFLYQILVVVAGVLLRKRGAFLAASLGAVCYGLLSVALLYGWLHPERLGPEFAADPATVDTALQTLAAHYVGFFLVAALMALVSGRMETARRALGDAELNLREARTFIEQLVSSLAWGVLTTDDRGVVTFSNPAGMRLLGETLPHGWGLEERLRHLGYDGPPLFGPSAPAEREVEVSLPEGRHLTLVVAPLRSGTSPFGFLALLRDQTEVVRLREELAFKDRLLAVGAMAADMAHEIRNPLGSISGAAQMLARSTPPGSPGGDLLKILQEESRRLSDILDSFLRYVKPPPLHRVSLDLRPLVQDVTTLFQRDGELGEVSLTLTLPEGPVPVRADPDRIRQALWNLLQNARRAVSAGGHIAVRLETEASAAILEVEDDGVGMRQEEVRAFFQPFRHGFRKGIGLGLSVVHQVATEHDGRVAVESAYGKGSRFRLVLPLEEPHG